MRYASIIDNDMVDGEGWVVSVWLQGCPHHCKGCHNPETWSFNAGKEEEYSSFFAHLEKALYANGIQRNLSILGGEPLCPQNIQYTYDIVSYIHTKFPTIKITVWTGYILEELLEKEQIYQDTLKLIDVLVDGPFVLEKRNITLKMRGSSNQRIINLKERIK